MKIAAGKVEPFLRRPDPKTPVVLIYGPDEGLVRERAALLIKSVLDDPGDPFRLSDLAADQIRSDPGLLADEARALCLMGGRRVVRVRQAADGLRAAVTTLLALETIDALVVLESRRSRPRVVAAESRSRRRRTPRLFPVTGTKGGISAV